MKLLDLSKITGSDIIRVSDNIYKSTLYFSSLNQIELFKNLLDEERVKELIRTNRFYGEYNFDYIRNRNNITRFSTIKLDNIIIRIKDFTYKEENIIEISFEFVIYDSNKEIIEEIKEDLSKVYLFPRYIITDSMSGLKLRLITIDLLRRN